MSATGDALYLIDGYAQFYRAFHAIRTPMTSPVTKEPTNLTFGFVGMMLKLLRGEGQMAGPPGGVIVTLDVSGDRESFRSALYPEYKATRPPIPEEMPVQIERCLSILEAIGVPRIGEAGFEADDVIATIVDRVRADSPERLVRIVSKDKDLKQLLEPGRVELYDVHTDVVFDAAQLETDTGLAPAQVVDMLALMGDNSDNIPGVEGIGPKTAAQLIAQYGSLEALMRHADEVKGKRGERLRGSLDRLPLNISLVTLERRVPVAFDLDDATVSGFTLEPMRPILRELGFNRFIDELDELIAGPGARETQAPAPSGGGIPGGLFDGLMGADEPAGVGGSIDAACIRSRPELDALLGRLRDAAFVAVDVETDGVNAHQCALCGIAIATEAGAGDYIPVRSPAPDTHLDTSTVLDALRPFLEDPMLPKIGQNLKFDLMVLRRHGVMVRGLTPVPDGPTGFDTMIASYLIDASRSSHSLDALSMALLGRSTTPLRDLIGSGSSEVGFDRVDLARAAPYAVEDVDVALALREVMAPELERMGLGSLYGGVELPLVEVLAEMEHNGITVDRDELARQRVRLETRLAELKDELDQHAYESLGRTFNPDSPKQLSAVLFGARDGVEPGLGLKPIKRTKTGFSTDIEVLEKLAGDASIETPIPGLVVEHRQLAKLVGTYLGSLDAEIHPETGRIHASFNQTVAATGRLSSSDPNLQNIPIRTDVGREIRRAFVAPEGSVLISADYSQIELRLLAHLADDAALKQAFAEGQDIHRSVAAQIHGVPLDEVTSEQRSGAKMVNFGIVYGITPFGLARRLGIGQSEAAEIISGYKHRFSAITTFLQECVAQATRLGYVETILHRRRPIPEIEARNPARRALAGRMAINSVVQGSAADLIKLAMVRLHWMLAPSAAHLRGGKPPAIDGVRMILQIHDELVFEAPASVADSARSLIVGEMEGAMDLSVPLVVDSAIATNWFEGE